jgi:hypothetical protein
VPTISIPIHQSLGILIQRNKTEEEIKGIQISKEEMKLSLFTDDDMILYLKDYKTFTQKLLDTINSFSKVAGCKINLKKINSLSIHQQ